MIHLREKFIEMLKRIDKEENKGGRGEERLIQSIKEALESSPQLTSWIESVKRKYPITKFKVYVLIVSSFFLNIILGWGFPASDFATDWNFVDGMKSHYQQSSKLHRICNQSYAEEKNGFNDTKD